MELELSVTPLIEGFVRPGFVEVGGSKSMFQDISAIPVRGIAKGGSKIIESVREIVKVEMSVLDMVHHCCQNFFSFCFIICIL